MGIEIGVIGGTGIYKLPEVINTEQQVMKTPYGNAVLTIGDLSGKQVAFLTRHGEDHSIAPGKINARANIWALKELGVKQILATACSGSLNTELPQGTLVLIDQFIEFTRNRLDSFFIDRKNEKGKLAHIDVTHPYCARLGEIVLEAGRAVNIPVKTGATYACVEGPRFESAAEIRMYQTLGADLVAQTQYPEVVLAREAEICYCAIGMVANMAAGLTAAPVSATEMKENMTKIFDHVQLLLAESIRRMDDTNCSCHHALDDSYL
ncbi:MAG: S-methyl-5'-thioinosine phosphorylase [Tissierellia bacterium]|nr:S-methyl-5'-thioinosine phosphorylase [Tissierellia bacterium]